METGRSLLFIAVVTLWLATGRSLPSQRAPINFELSDDECDQGHDELLCATNYVTYLNLCEFEKAIEKDPTLKLIENGACVCDKTELHEWDPLCSSNGESYANNCELIKARKAQKDLHIRHLGLCNAMLKRNVITPREQQKLALWRTFMPHDLYKNLSNRPVAGAGLFGFKHERSVHLSG